MDSPMDLSDLDVEIRRELGIFPLPEGLRISVVVPIYNEKATVVEIGDGRRETRDSEFPAPCLPSPLPSHVSPCYTTLPSA